MNKNLEFIEKEIALTKFLINYTEASEKEIETLKEKLFHLKQIKTELKAWYIIKPDFVLQWDNPNDASGYYLRYFGDYEYEIINRAERLKGE